MFRWDKAALVAALLAALACPALADGPSIDPTNMTRVGTVDERFQSYNVEMVEVTGGRFWKPYGPEPPTAGTDLYAYRPPIDLNNIKLRKLAAALGPAYMRVSGTWANSTYFSDTESTHRPCRRPGFNSVLTRRQWRDVVNFSQAVDAKLVTSFAISPGSRDAAGVWTPDQAHRLLAYTGFLGGSIAAAEFMNEPDLPAISGAPAGYDAAAYGRDFKIFRSFVKQTAPEMMVLGPGAAGQAPLASDLLAASGPGVDVFSYHHYGTLSERCIGSSTPDAALSEAWLAQTDQALGFHRTLRDEFEPGKPIWLTETADAACGGNRWSATFLDTFRYLDQLGRLAKAGVQVVMHNTLAASDYGLLDETNTGAETELLGRAAVAPADGSHRARLRRADRPRPSCLRPLPARRAGRCYSFCLSIRTGIASRSLTLASASERYTLDATSLRSTIVQLNGTTLALDDTGRTSIHRRLADARRHPDIRAGNDHLSDHRTAGNDACR